MVVPYGLMLFGGRTIKGKCFRGQQSLCSGCCPHSKCHTAVILAVAILVCVITAVGLPIMLSEVTSAREVTREQRFASLRKAYVAHSLQSSHCSQILSEPMSTAGKHDFYVTPL